MDSIQLHDQWNDGLLNPNYANGAVDTRMEPSSYHSPIHEDGNDRAAMTERPLANNIAEIGVVALAGIALALFGAFGTDALPLGNRFLYWIVGMLVAWLVFRGIVAAMRELTQLVGISEVFSYILAIPALGAVIMIPQSLLGNRTARADQSVSMYAQILGLGLAFFALFWMIYYRAASRTAQDKTAPSAPLDVSHTQIDPAGLSNTALHQKLPAGFGPIIALSMEDHYVRVHSVRNGETARSELLLMKLSDAIALMGTGVGIQTHRSWWVAARAVSGHTRVGRNIHLILTSGVNAPVSRKNVTNVRAAGLLD